ncbi:MFS monocarboxylate transporter [Heterobasidion irregulare TC 32-1]|uniref:MFS monocarboxylate transporter n=1 Tax=Heterobasidion irregulare (strain TC 32-1) TaxID=747525 RepID=W4K1W7_HETIT|nr:MFS monocarboxylate transporter [Heterobasidion irregulare TC 32-1]ETW79330.1 MFS monocarboxylate transporter [Heterobasidion irregulare TC 32-1]
MQLDILHRNPEATSRKSENRVANAIVEAADSRGDGSQAINIQATIDDLPDGGYGWVIVAACSLISFFHIGLTYSWGIVQARLSASHLAKDSTLSFIGSTAVAFVSFAALVNARIIRRLGTRNSALLGCFSLGFGQILNGWASYSIAGLFVTNGVIVGFGTSLCFMTCGSLPAQYFKRRRGLANGFVFAGGGIGGGVWSLSISSLIDRVGIPWTFRILGLITLTTTMPAAMLLKERVRRAPATVEWRLFLDPKFILLFLGSALATFPILVPAFFIPLYANSLGASAFTASALLALFNLSSAVGRVGFGALGDRIGPISALALTLLLAAVSMLAIWPVSASLAPLVVFIVLNGIGNGGFFSTMPSVIGHMYGSSRVASALAMVVTGWAFGYLLGSPVAGWLLDAYGGSSAGRTAFRPAIYFAGSLSLLSVVLITAMRHMVTKNKIFVFA